MSERPTIDELRVRLAETIKAKADRLVAAFAELELVLIDIKNHEAELIACDHEEHKLRAVIISLGGKGGLL